MLNHVPYDIWAKIIKILQSNEYQYADLSNLSLTCKLAAESIMPLRLHTWKVTLSGDEPLAIQRNRRRNQDLLELINRRPVIASFFLSMELSSGSRKIDWMKEKVLGDVLKLISRAGKVEKLTVTGTSSTFLDGGALEQLFSYIPDDNRIQYLTLDNVGNFDPRSLSKFQAVVECSLFGIHLRGGKIYEWCGSAIPVDTGVTAMDDTSEDGIATRQLPNLRSLAHRRRSIYLWLPIGPVHEVIGVYMTMKNLTEASLALACEEDMVMVIHTLNEAAQTLRRLTLDWIQVSGGSPSPWQVEGLKKIRDSAANVKLERFLLAFRSLFSQVKPLDGMEELLNAMNPASVDYVRIGFYLSGVLEWKAVKELNWGGVDKALCAIKGSHDVVRVDVVVQEGYDRRARAIRRTELKRLIPKASKDKGIRIEQGGG